MTKFELLEQLAGVGILVQDLRLFLDVNPTDKKALADFERVTADYRNLAATYEQSHGPLTGCHDMNSTWAASPWPWHRNFGGNA